jgi:hypothetical protein
MTRYRVGAIIAVLFAIFFLPYWLYLPSLLAAMIVFPIFWEGIVLAYLIDILYGRGIGTLAELLSPMAFTAALLLIVLIPVRERLRI